MITIFIEMWKLERKIFTFSCQNCIFTFSFNSHVFLVYLASKILSFRVNEQDIKTCVGILQTSYDHALGKATTVCIMTLSTPTTLWS